MEYRLILSPDDPDLGPYANQLFLRFKQMDTLQRQYWLDGANVEVLTKELQMTTLAERWIDNTRIILALEGENVCGFIEFTYPVEDASILWMGVQYLYIDPGKRHHGVATELLDRVRDIARSENINQLTLSVNLTNGPARALYARYGFKEQLSYLSLSIPN